MDQNKPVVTSEGGGGPLSLPNQAGLSPRTAQSEKFTLGVDAGVRYVEMLMRHLPNGSLLHKIINATSKELWDDPLPELFGTEAAVQVSPELFCGSCKVHLGMWDAFHGGVVETEGKPLVRMCSNDCLLEMINHPPMSQVAPTAFADDYELCDEEMKVEA